MVHTKAFSIVNEAEIDLFLELSGFLQNPTHVSNLVSSSSSPSKSSLYFWKFSIHILLKPTLEDFEHNLANVGNECNCMVVGTFFGTALRMDWNID